MPGPKSHGLRVLPIPPPPFTHARAPPPSSPNSQFTQVYLPLLSSLTNLPPTAVI